MSNTINWDSDQKKELEAGRSAGVDVSYYENPKFLAVQMRQIRMGLEQGLNVAVYAKEEYDWFQMEELRKGLVAGIDIGKYSDPKIPYDVMRQVRRGLEDGLDLSGFVNLKPDIIRELRLSAKEKINIIDFVQKGFDAESLKHIRHGLKKQLRFAKYIKPTFLGEAVHQIIRGVEHNVDVSAYARDDYSWRQMREVRLGMEHQIDVSHYVNSLYSADQMREIREGLEDGLDVTKYRSFMYTANEMRKIRLDLLARNGRPRRHGLKYIDEENYYLTVADDAMEVRLIIKGNSPGLYSSEAILGIFESNGINAGILNDEIDDMIAMGICDSRVVARGAAPTKGIDGFYDYFVDVSMMNKPELLADGSVNYHNMQRFKVVKEGEPIAVYHPAQHGHPGYNVYGEDIIATKGKELKLITGKGFKILDDKRTYIASVTGRIIIDKENLKIDVSPTLVVQDINLGTGDINFNGSVHVFGEVARGSSIVCTEDLVIDGSVGACRINAGGNVFVRNGINGMGEECTISAGGNVDGLFFESVTIVAKGNLEANYCLNCMISVTGHVKISGVKGILAGGKTSAVKGIECYDIGNKVGLGTYISMGVNDAMRKEEMQYAQKLAGIEQELSIFRSAVKKFEKIYPPEVCSVTEQYIKLENAVFTKEQEKEKLEKKAKELQDVIRGMTKPKAIVNGTLYEGVTFEIDRIRLSIPQDVNNVMVTRENARIAIYRNH